MTIASDVAHMLEQPLRADELKKWPLMHGSDTTAEGLADMRRNGLISGRGTNSYGYDEALGRTKRVFLAPSSFRLNYGYGGCAILVDPAILSRRSDLRFSHRDIGEAIECLHIILEHGNANSYCGQARDVPRLARLVSTKQSAVADMPWREAVAEIARDPEFQSYYATNYLLSEQEFFARIEGRATECSCALRGYFSRNSMWPTEEILVPNRIETEFLLGHWNGRQWTKWNEPSSADVEARLEAWLASARQWSPR